MSEYLLLPGYGSDHPTLESFSYDAMKDTIIVDINRPGIAQQNIGRKYHGIVKL